MRNFILPHACFISEAAGAALITGISTLASTGVNAASVNGVNRKNYKYSKQIMDAQNEYNTKMWERTNSYNSPISQKNRLIEAGINPNMLYGDVHDPNATMQTSAAPGSPIYQPFQVDTSVADSLGSLDTQLADVQKKKVETENARETTKLIQQQIESQGWDNLKKHFDANIAYVQSWLQKSAYTHASGKDFNLSSHDNGNESIVEVDAGTNNDLDTLFDSIVDGWMKDGLTAEKMDEERKRLSATFEDFKTIMHSDAELSKFNSSIAELVNSIKVHGDEHGVVNVFLKILLAMLMNSR